VIVTLWSVAWALPPSMLVLAQTGAPAEWAPLLNFGAVGVLVVLFLTGRIHIGSELQQVRKERDDALADARQLRDSMLQSVVPAMTRMTEAAIKATEALTRERRYGE
jgi:hypothetical protein